MGAYARRTIAPVRIRGDSPWAQFADLWRGGLARETPSTLLLPLLALWGIGITTSVSILIAVTPDVNVQTMLGILGYSLLGMISLVAIVVNTLLKKTDFINIANFGYTKVIRPLLVGAFEVLIPFLALIYITNQFQQEGGLLSQQLSVGAYNIAFLAPAETLFFFWSFPTSWRPGALLAPFVFATDHPIIWKNVLAGVSSTQFVPLLLTWFGLVSIGFIFMSLVFMGLVKLRHSALFCVPNAIGSHSVYNAIAMTFVVILSVFGVQFHLGVI